MPRNWILSSLIFSHKICTVISALHRQSFTIPLMKKGDNHILQQKKNEMYKVGWKNFLENNNFFLYYYK